MWGLGGKGVSRQISEPPIPSRLTQSISVCIPPIVGIIFVLTTVEKWLDIATDLPVILSELINFDSTFVGASIFCTTHVNFGSTRLVVFQNNFNSTLFI